VDGLVVVVGASIDAIELKQAEMIEPMERMDIPLSVA
jgi:hypothetical protein